MMKKYNRILLIDDDPIQNLINTKLLSKLEVTDHIQVAKNGVEAFDRYLESTLDLPDIIFLDINMPIMNGWQFLDSLSLKKLGILPRIFMLTSSISPEDIKKSINHQMVENYITKPLSINKLKFLKKDLELY